MPARLDHVELSKRTLRERAAAFAVKHADDASEMAERQTSGTTCSPSSVVR